MKIRYEYKIVDPKIEMKNKYDLLQNAIDNETEEIDQWY